MKKLALILCTVFLLTSCQNFLKGADVKNELERIIEYNNAPSYTIRVDSEKNRGVVKSPAGGEAQKKVTDVFEVSFNPSSDFEFLKWKIIDTRTKKEYPNGKYLTLDSLTEDTTNCTFTNAPDAGVQLTLFAVVAKRPRVISASPQISDNGAYRDARIRVIFDKPMESKSIYYNGQEQEDLEAEYGSENIAFLNAGTPEKVYGYTYKGRQYYKNIQIVNQKTDISVLENFTAPYFEDPVTLVIPPEEDNPPAGNSNLCVTIESGVSRKEDNKSITLKEDYPWMYFVNSSTDNDPPSGESIIKDINDKSISNDSTAEPSLIYEQKIKLYVSIMDNGSGPAGTFKLRFTNVDNANDITQLDIGYDSITNTTATFKDDSAQSGNKTPKEYTISGVTDGNYILNVVYYDKNFKEALSENYYVTIDNTAPDVTETKISYSENQSNGKVDAKIEYTCEDEDLKNVKVRYKNKNDNSAQWSETKSFNKGVDVSLSLSHGIQYIFDINFYDITGNCYSTEKTVWMPVDEVNNFTVTPERTEGSKAKATLTWTKPEGEFDYYEVAYRKYNKNNRPDDNYTKISPVDKNTLSYTISDLKLNESYDFKISTIQNENSLYSKYYPCEECTKKMPIHAIEIKSISVKQRSGYDNDYYVCVESSGTGSEQYPIHKLYYSESEFTTSNTGNCKTIDMSNYSDGPNYQFYVTEYKDAKIENANNSPFKWGKTYYFAICIESDNEKSWSQIIQFMVGYEVENLTAEIITGTKCKFNYTIPTGLKKKTIKINCYLIDSNNDEREFYSSGLFSPSSTDLQKSHVVTGLTPNTNYTIRVKLIVLIANTSTEKVTNIQIKTKDVVELQTTATAGDDFIKVEWTKPDDITVNRYVVWCRQEAYNEFGVADSVANGQSVQMNGLTYENGNWNGGISDNSTDYQFSKWIYKSSVNNNYYAADILTSIFSYEIIIEGYALQTGVPVLVVSDYRQVSKQSAKTCNRFVFDVPEV